MTYSKQKCSESKRRTYLMFIAFDKPSGEDDWETTDSEDNYYDKWTRISEHINDFVRIIMERKKLKEYMAEAVAWEAIKTEIVKITPQEFNEQYSRIRLSDALYESEKMIEKKKENRTRMLFEAVLHEEEMMESW